MEQIPSAQDLLSEALRIYLKKWKSFIKLFLFTRLYYIPAIVITLLLIGVISIFTRPAKLFDSNDYITFGIPFGLFIIFMIILESSLLISQFFLFNDQQENIDFKELPKMSLKYIIPFYLLTLLQGMVILGGLILLVIPGLIFFIEYYFTSFIFLLENKKPEEALALSREMVKGRFWIIVKRLLALHLLFFAINFMPRFLDSSIAKWLFEIATILILNPIIFIYSLVLYKKTRETYSPPLTEAKPNKTIYWVMPLLVIIFLGLLILIIYQNKFKPAADLPIRKTGKFTLENPNSAIYLSPTPPRTRYWDRKCSFAMINFDTNKIEDTSEGELKYFYYLDKPEERITITCLPRIARPQISEENTGPIIVDKQIGMVFKDLLAENGSLEDWIIVHHPDKDLEIRISGPRDLLQEKIKLFSFIWG